MNTADFGMALLRARQEGASAMQALAETQLPLVGLLVRRFPPSPATREELFQQGVIGLMQALSRFDPARGTAFSTYAAPLILGEMRTLHRQCAVIRMPRSETGLRRRIGQAEDALTRRFGRKPAITELADTLHMDAAELTLHLEGITVVSADGGKQGRSPLEELADPEDWQARVELRDILTRLPEMDQRLIRLRFRRNMTQAQAGAVLGMSQMQVSRRERVIRTLLARALAE